MPPTRYSVTPSPRTALAHHSACLGTSKPAIKPTGRFQRRPRAGHGVRCEYGDPFVPSSNGTSNPSPLSQNRPSQSSPVASPHGPDSPYADLEDIEHAFTADERRLLELRLLHHYTTVVTNTFTADPFRHVWLIDGVRLGFENAFLLNAIFAITSLHIVCDGGERPRVYANDPRPLSIADAIDRPKVSLGNIDHAKAHRIYLNLAVRTQREAVASINPENADAVFLASVLLSYQALKLLPDSPSPDVYLPPTSWLRMSKAIAVVVQAALPFTREGSVVDMIQKTQMEPDLKDHAAIFNPQHRKPFEALLDWSRSPEPNLDLEGRRTYEETLAYIGGVWQAILDKETPRHLFRRLVSMAILVPAQFATFLDEGRPRALVILAHHFAMAKAAEEHWWLRGVADREVKGIQSLVPAEWQWAMEWPLSLLHQVSG